MNDTDEPEFLNKGNLLSPSNNHGEKMDNDNPIPLIISDIMQPSRNSPKTPQRQQNSTWESPGRKGSTSATASLLPSTSKIAVHIKSAASPSSHLQHKTSTTLYRGRGLRPKPEPALMRNKSPYTLPFPQEVGGPSLQPRKRGRPKGWKPGTGMSYTDVSGYTTPAERKKPKPKPTEQTKEAKRRGRPPRPPALSARELYLRSRPGYLPFKCEWEESPGKPCPAELQNIKTLRQHVYIIHGDRDLLVCRWGKCAAKEPELSFANDDDFEEHMEKEHIRPFVWHVGEGYQNNGISTLNHDAAKLPAYLFDKDGNQVTPSVVEQRFEDDQHHKERRQKLRQLQLMKDKNAPTEEEYMRQTLGLTS
ncbi:hypothetical protein F4779DRAFT_564503 [Xylariaceae sp. FL0662B]|nr:hypothetical protein F4779DRAFT_564503 [Xylariaceae sp. FL0662B]